MRQVLLLLLLSLFLPVIAIGQVPQKFNYQAAVRNSDGTIMAEQEVALKVILRKTTAEGDIVYQEDHTLTTSVQGLIAVEVGMGGNPVGDFALIPWEESIFIQIDIKKGNDASYVTLGVSQILSVPYALHAGNAIQGNAVEGQTVVHNGDAWAASNRMLVSQNTVEILPEEGRDEEEPLFSVRNSEGLLVFAVYESGAKVYVSAEDGVKGNRGGFAIGGFSDQTKEGGVDYLTIFPDMVQFNIQQSAENGMKGNRGGFAVGGFSDQTKGVNHNFFTVSPDSAKFILTDDHSKGNRGGFAVGGFSDQTKGYTDYLTVNRDSTNVLTNLATTGNVQVQGDIQTGGSVGSLPIVIDGDSYETVTIGSQIWMKENLRTINYNDGTAIEKSNVTQYPDSLGGALEIYGMLYSQNAIFDSKGLCPTGRRIPKENDWNKLFKEFSEYDYPDANQAAPSLMDNSGTWLYSEYLTPTNISGFTAVPGGYGIKVAQDIISYSGLGQIAHYWYTNLQGVGGFTIDLMDGAWLGSADADFLSVRCIKN